MSTPSGEQYVVLSTLGLHYYNEMTFQVAAPHDAHLILMTDHGTDIKKHYHIGLGGWGNTKSIIIQESLVQYKGVVLNGTEYKDFWIDWDICTINVGHGTIVNKHTFLTYESPDALSDIVDIGIRTFHGANGTWLFYHEGGIVLYHFLSSIDFCLP